MMDDAERKLRLARQIVETAKRRPSEWALAKSWQPHELELIGGLIDCRYVVNMTSGRFHVVRTMGTSNADTLIQGGFDAETFQNAKLLAIRGSIPCPDEVADEEHADRLIEIATKPEGRITDIEDSFKADGISETYRTPFDFNDWIATAPENSPDGPEWLTISAVERMTGINRGTISRDWLKAGLVSDNGKSGQERRVNAGSLLQYCQQHGIAICET